MAAIAEACDLPQAQPALEEAHGPVVQKIVYPAPIQLGATTNEPPLIDATAVALAVGQHIEAVLDYRGEQLRAPAATVEDNGDPPLADHVAHLTQQTGHSLCHGSIDLSGDHQQWVTRGVVDPVIGGSGHGQMAARYISI